MVETSTGLVVNTHHYKGVDHLPPDTVYIGRPSIYGNAYSMESGKYTREECIALHKVDLYQSLTTTPLYLAKLREDLEGRKLACWCKHPKKIVGCHGDNYAHVLSSRLKDRVYDKSPLHYIMDDLRFILAAFEAAIKNDVDAKDYLDLFIHFNDVRIEIQYFLVVIKDKWVPSDDLCVLIANVVVELELAFQNKDPALIHFWFDHVIWVIDRFMGNRKDRLREPIMPNQTSLKRKAK